MIGSDQQRERSASRRVRGRLMLLAVLAVSLLAAALMVIAAGREPSTGADHASSPARAGGLTKRPVAEVAHPAMPAVRDRIWRVRDGVRLGLDVDYPARIDRGGAPVVVLLHGGGWWSGSRSQLTRTGGLAHEFAAAGFVAVSVDYGLACGTKSNPRALWGDDYSTDNSACGAYMRDELADVREVVRWVHAHAGELHVDPTRVGLFGSSAGGHLALYAAFTASERAPVAAVATWSGPPSTEYIARQPKVPTPESKSLRAPFANAVGCDRPACPAAWDEASPMRHLGAGTGRVAVLTIAGETETQVPMAQFARLHARLDALGLPNELVAGAGDCHGTGCGMRRLANRDDAGIDATIAFLREHLR